MKSRRSVIPLCLLGIFCLVSSVRSEESPTITRLQADQIMKKVSEGRLLLMGDKDLHGQSAFVVGDFNSDGHQDLAMVGAPLLAPHKTFLIIATQSKNEWQLAYSLPLQD